MNAKKLSVAISVFLVTGLIVKYLYDDARRANAILSVPIAEPFEVSLKGEPTFDWSGYSMLDIAWRGKTIGPDRKAGPEADQETRVTFDAALPRDGQPMHQKAMLAFQRLTEGKRLYAICLKPADKKASRDISCDLLTADNISVAATMIRNGYAVPSNKFKSYVTGHSKLYGDSMQRARAERRGQWSMKRFLAPWNKEKPACEGDSSVGGLFKAGCDNDTSPPGDLVLVHANVSAIKLESKGVAVDQQPADKSSMKNVVGKTIDKAIDKAGEKVAEKVVERVTDDLKDDIMESVFKKLFRF